MLHKWQIITLKLRYDIYDYNNNAFNINDFDNELDEPQLENKPNLYLNNKINNFKNNILNNYKSKSSVNKKSKRKTNKSLKNTIGYNKMKNDNSGPKNIKKNNNVSSINNKTNKTNRNINRKNKTLDNFINSIESNKKNNKLNKTQNNNKEEDGNEETTNEINKTFEEKFHTFEHPESNNNLENLILDNNNNNQNEEIFFISENKINNNINNNVHNKYKYNDIDISSNLDNFNLDMNKSKSVDKKRNINDLVSIKTKPWVYSYYRRDNNDEDAILKIKKKRPTMNNSERQELFNKLYNDNQKRKEKYKKLSMEKEAKFNTIYTFTPKIITNKLNDKYLKNMADTKFNTNTNTTTFYNNGMNNTSLITKTNYNNNHSSVSNAKIDTNKKTKSEIGGIREENKDEFPLDFMTRLAEYEKIKKMNLEKIKNEVDINIKGNNIYKYKNKYQKIPNNHLLNNSQKYLESKQKNLERIAQNMFEEQGITFQPKTNKSFNDKIKNDIIERNKEFLKDKQEKIEKFSYLKEKECTFKPKINTSYTLAILNNSKGGQYPSLNQKIEPNNEDVSKRLFDYQNKYKEKLEDIRSKYKVSYSFKPEISKNTDTILNNKKKMMEQIKENENNIINNIQEGYGYDLNNLNNNNNNNNINNVIYNNNNMNMNINNELLMKQLKLGELEEISKRISELSEENMIYTDEKLSSQKKNKNIDKIINNKTKILNENKQLVFNDNNNSIENNDNFQINPSRKKRNITLPVKEQTNNDNSDKILELAKNLLKESNQQKSIASIENYNNYNKNKECNNDFGSIMMYNNIKNNRYNNDYRIPSNKKSNYEKEYDYDNIKGKKIMNLNYYDSLL